jgi:uncharacterized Zn finger protein
MRLLGRKRYYEPVYWGYTPSRPIKVDDGIQLKSTRGEIGKQWWSKKWIQALERFTIATRLSRGKTYARGGQVISIDIKNGKATAKVQGSKPRPYTVSIQVTAFTDHQWDAVLDLMASRAIFAAKLLCGEMPPNIEELFSDAGTPLFPSTSKDLDTDCTCPDVANPCKHIAAVHYILAEKFDDDPFVIFELRGRTKQQIVDALRSRRAVAGEKIAEGALTHRDGENSSDDGPFELSPQAFWGTNDSRIENPVNLQPPAVEQAALKLLGPSPFIIQGKRLEEILGKVYAITSSMARKKFIEKEEQIGDYE